VKSLAFVLATTLLAGGCQAFKWETRCEREANTLSAATTDTAFYLERVQPELKAGFRALLACDRISEDCDAELWLTRAQTLKFEHRGVHARFANAVDQWRPEACVSHVRTWRIDPPDPDAYRGYFFALSETGDQIDELLDRFERRAG
jgi:hypothetical protein